MIKEVIMRKTFSLKTVLLLSIFSISLYAQSPVITVQPHDQGIIEGQTATFEVVASGDSLTYQWYLNDTTLIVGATDSIYTTPAVIPADNLSQFKCIVTNSFGSDESNNAILYVTAAGSRVSNGVQLLYDFKEATGKTVYDQSGIGTAYNLTMYNPKAFTWTPNGLGTNYIPYLYNSNPASKIINACKLTNELTIEVWIRPALETQTDGSRILSLSGSTTSSNFSIYQMDKYYIFRSRTTTTGSRGEPGISTAVGSASTDLVHLMFTRSKDGTAKVYMDGVEINSALISGNFSNWDSNFILQLASELESPREWYGTFYLVSAYNRALSQAEVTENFNVGVPIDHKPEIIIEPNDLGLLVGQPATFSVKSVGDDVLTYRWYKNGSIIPGAVNSSYTIPSVSLSNNGDFFYCNVTNSAGADVSRFAKLYVTDTDERVEVGQTVLYNFQDGVGDTIKDVSGYGTPLNLKINTPNAVEWRPYGLLIDSAANINSTDIIQKIYDDAVATNEFTFEGWIKPENLTQLSATIFSLSANSTTRRNFKINQEINYIRSWLRTSTTDEYGLNLNTPVNSLKDSLVHLVFTRNGKEQSQIFINGIQVANRFTFDGNLSTWRPDYTLKLANDAFYAEPWKGLLNMISMYSRALTNTEITHNYNIGPVGNINVNIPVDLTAQADLPGRVKITWTDNSPAEDGFVIERKQDSFNYAIIATVSANSVEFIDTNIVDNTNYTYRIKAYNLLYESNYSNESSVTTLYSSINAPSSLSAVLSPTLLNHIELIWQDNSPNELGFIVERKIGDSLSSQPFSVIDTVATDVTSFTDSNVEDTTTYTYKVKAFDQFLQSDYTNQASVSSVLSNLQAPTNLAVELSSVNINHALLSWQDNSQNESGFVIERKNGDASSTEPFILLDTVLVDVTTYEDSTLSDTTTYTYRVRASNLYLVSAYTNLVTIHTLLTNLSAPNNLTVDLHSTGINHASLNWNDNSSNELGFIIERKLGNTSSAEPFLVLDTLAADLTSIIDSTLSDTTTYTFRVKAFNSFFESGYSNLVSISTILSTIAAPQNLNANLTIMNHAILTWEDRSSNELGFIVERKIGNSASSNPFLVLDTLSANITSFTDMTLADTTTYTFRVKSFNNYLESDYSNLASVTSILASVSAPSNLEANLHTTLVNRVVLSWSDNSPNELGFYIERKTGDSASVEPYSILDTLSANSISFTDSNLNDTTTYTYRVQAFNSFFQSGYSNLASISTVLSFIIAPTELAAALSSTAVNHVVLSWKDNSTNELGFIVERKTGDSASTTSYVVLDSLDEGVVTFEDSTLSDTTTYTYRIMAFNKYIQSNYSSTASITTVLSAIIREISLEIPKDFALSQNYPNPFNPSTNIRFALPTSAEVQIKLYNSIGQEVESILNSHFNAGVHEIAFNAQRLSSGVYFYMINAQGINGNNFISTRRMILMK